MARKEEVTKINYENSISPDGGMLILIIRSNNPISIGDFKEVVTEMVKTRLEDSDEPDNKGYMQYDYGSIQEDVIDD